MKKVLVIALAVLMLVGAVSVLAACNGGETYTGYCYYPSPYGAGGYGCVVDVTVNGDTIVGIKLYTDKEAAAWAKGKTFKAWVVENANTEDEQVVEKEVTWDELTHRTSTNWISEAEYNILMSTNPKLAESMKNGYIAPHGGDIGHDRAEAAYQAWFEEAFIGKTVAEVNLYVASVTQKAQAVADDGTPKIAGATQSSARIIVAIKNALAQIEAK